MDIKSFESFDEAVKVYDYEFLDSYENFIVVDFEHTNIGRMRFRVLGEGDSSRIEDFYKKGLSQNSRMTFGPPDEFFMNENWISFIKDYPNYAFLKDNSLVAHFFLRKFGEEGNTAELGIGVADSFQRKGLGRLGLKLLEQIGKMRGLDSIWLNNFCSNSRAASLYEKEGYKIMGEEFMKLNRFTGKEVKTVRRIKKLSTL